MRERDQTKFFDEKILVEVETLPAEHEKAERPFSRARGAERSSACRDRTDSRSTSAVALVVSPVPKNYSSDEMNNFEGDHPTRGASKITLFYKVIFCYQKSFRT